MVSGTVDPDTFVVQRSYRNNNLKISERNLGGKDYVTIMENHAAGVNSSKIDEKLRNKFCLNDENLLKLCEIGIYLEKCSRSPRDIEWAVHKVNNMDFVKRFQTLFNENTFENSEKLDNLSESEI